MSEKKVGRPAGIGVEVISRNLAVIKEALMGGFNLAKRLGFKGNFDDYLRETSPNMDVMHLQPNGTSIMIKARDLPASTTAGPTDGWRHVKMIGDAIQKNVEANGQE